MILGHPVPIRLNHENLKALEEEAARQGKPLGTYLREIIESRDIYKEMQDLKTELAVFRNLIESSVLKDQNSQQTDNAAFLLEILLLLRSIAGPDRISMVASEIKRNGFEIWQPKG